VLGGTPAAAGLFHFTLRVRDYHENSAGLAQDCALRVSHRLHSIPAFFPK
jgi:hypothetical protein